MALSPEGNRIAFVAIKDRIRQIYLRDLEGEEARPMVGTEGAFCTPFFSPDGQWLGFWADGHLKKVSVAGGSPVNLTPTGGITGASWGPDDTIIFSGGNTLQQISAAGGEPKFITTVDTAKGELHHRWPQFLPGGKAVLFAVAFSVNLDDTQIVVQRLDTGERKLVAQGGTFPHYLPSGHVVYNREGTLLGVPFDLERLEVTGAPVPVAENVMEAAQGAADVGFSGSGSLIYVPGGAAVAQRSLAWVDRKGTAQPLATLNPYEFPKLSPDGHRAAVSLEGILRTLWIYDFERDTLTRLLAGGYPVWTPDGKRVTFSSGRNLFWKPVDGGGTEERLTTSEYQQYPVSWSPDSRFLAFVENRPTTGSDIWVLPMEGNRKPQPWLQTPSNESNPMFSPDGRWLAYVSNESGRYEVYVRAFQEQGEKWQVSSEGGEGVSWSRDGRELFYRSGDKMMVVDVTTGPSFTAGKPRLLFEGPYKQTGGFGEYVNANYDISPDGQRFLMIQPSEQELAATQVNVVLNWFEDLKRKVPTGK